MQDRYEILDRFFTELSATRVFAIAIASILVVGLLDYAAGYEITFSLFYLAPIALAAWYAGRRSAIATAVFAAGIWLLADTAAGHPYSHPLITLWELLVRLGVFMLMGLALAALRAALDRERDLARTDALTGVATRRAFDEQFEHDLRLTQRSDGILSLAFLDLDDFKQVNDRYGHGAGDRVLRIIGDVLNNSTREADTVARLGGDEFVLLFPNTDPNGAEEAIAKIRHDVRQALLTTAPELTVDFSVGAITYLDAPQSIDEALSAADALMYAAKRSGKGAALFRVVTKRRAKRRGRHAAASHQSRKLASGTHHH